ncbi:RsmB/NOP family class I SAM-dependent RNA methyltransferase [Candidatus Woesearchaeota archaeon]|nr:RsmB/NOP family class I SAM-dependent RNA methyltransferase [Candidatus Woesearchaeota archaeon]
MNELLERYKELGHEIKKINLKIKDTIRINTIKTTENELIKRLEKKEIKLKKISYLKHGYEYKTKIPLVSTNEYLQGLIYIQETASQIPPEILDPKPNEIILDMAASPGSKTTQIAQLMNNKGTIIALDIDGKRTQKLKNNLERLSITNTIIKTLDGRQIKKNKILFDKILLDAPCSGNYCIEKEFFTKRKIKDFINRSWIQKELLDSAYKVLKKEGCLVYSTCSLEPEENEIVIDWFIKKYPDMKLQTINKEIGEPGIINPFGKSLSEEIKKTKRLWPEKTKTQGFFIAKLKKC